MYWSFFKNTLQKNENFYFLQLQYTGISVNVNKCVCVSVCLCIGRGYVKKRFIYFCWDFPLFSLLFSEFCLEGGWLLDFRFIAF